MTEYGLSKENTTTLFVVKVCELLSITQLAVLLKRMTGVKESAVPTQSCYCVFPVQETLQAIYLSAFRTKKFLISKFIRGVRDHRQKKQGKTAWSWVKLPKIGAEIFKKSSNFGTSKFSKTRKLAEKRNSHTPDLYFPSPQKWVPPFKKGSVPHK